MTVETDTLAVPGATLYYEVRGSGPVLLMIPGGPTEASIFTDLAGALEDRYTVVTYDPRGHSRGTVEAPDEDVPVALHADDARRLIKVLGTEPAYVFGSSGGAVIGLDLVGRHGDLVRALLAHEPPLMTLLPDADRWRETYAKIDATYRTQGTFPAMEAFGKAVEEGGPKYEPPPGEPSPEEQEAMTRMMGNFDFFLAHEIQTHGRYVPDIAVLKASPTRIVVGGGEESGQQGAYRAAVALAERLGTDLVRFPGAHGGFSTHTEAFAAKLHDVLAASPPDRGGSRRLRPPH